MSETAQLLNLLAGLPLGGGAPSPAPTGQAAPDAAGGKAFQALLLLAQAPAAASAQAHGVLDGKAEKPEGESRAPDALALLIPLPTQMKTQETSASDGTTPEQRLLLLFNAQPTELTPHAARPAPVEGNAEAALAAVDAQGGAAPSAEAMRAPNAQPQPEASAIAQAAHTQQNPGTRAGAAVQGTPQISAPAATRAAGEAPLPQDATAAGLAADPPASVKAEVFAQASEAPKPAPAREAIVNASLTAVASTLIGETPAPGAALGGPSEKRGATPASPATPAAPPAKDAAPRSTPEQPAPPKPEAAAPDGFDEAPLTREGFRAASADLATAQARAPQSEAAPAPHALAAPPLAHSHASVPVIVVRLAQGQQGAAFAADPLALAIMRQVQAGVSRFEIRLDPPELGRIEVKMSVRADGHVSAQLTADRPDTLELLQRDARALQRALGEAGLQMDSGSLSFGLRDHGGRPAFEEGDAPRAPFLDESEEDALAPPPYGALLALRLEPGRVDLWV